MFQWNALKVLVMSGVVWFGVGIALLTAGMKWILGSMAYPSLWMKRLSLLAGGQEEGAFFLIIIGLLIGFIKGRWVLSKTVQRVVRKVEALEAPFAISSVYGKGYFFLIAGMMGLGMSLRWFQVPLDIRGFVDVAVGSALMNGALLYVRLGLALYKQRSSV